MLIGLDCRFTSDLWYREYPNGDGLYRDTTGDGELGTDDVVTLFENLENTAVPENAEYYDFDGSGDVGPSDVIALFESL